MSMKMKLLAFFVLLTAVFPKTAAAVAPAMTVSPSIVRIDLAEDKPEATLRYVNDSDRTVELSFAAKDITYLEDGYKLSFLEKGDGRAFSYGLSSWISFDSSSLIVLPHEVGTLGLRVNKDRLGPGGHYGAVLATIQNKETSGNVELQGILSSLVFVRAATGNETEDAAVESLRCSTSLLHLPDRCSLKFRNRGNVDLTPYGQIVVKDMFGNRAASGILNEPSLSTFPESIRNYEVVMTGAGSVWPGLYRIELAGRYGKGNHRLAASSRFVSTGNSPLLWLFVAALLLSAAAGWLRLFKRKR